MNIIARGISTPNRFSGPDRSHSTLVNETTVTTELIAPKASDREVATKLVTSAWMRWSGLSMVSSMNRLR
jgi:hypothetical protein